MKITRVIATAAIVAAVSGQMSSAQSLRNADEPAEFPPASYSGTQYVDSRGCVYIRAGISGNVTWIPRVSRDRKQICGQMPSATTRTAAAVPAPAAAKPPVQITVARPVATPVPAPKPAAKPVVRKTVAQKARRAVRPAPVVIGAPRTAPVLAPVAVPRQQVQVPQQQASVCGVTAVSRKYINLNSNLPVRCGPQAAPIVGGTFATQPQVITPRTASVAPVAQPRRITSVPQGIATGGTVNSGTRVVPRHVYANRQNTQNTTVPSGYREVWTDDRLNPKRAEQSVGGVLKTNYLWTNTVPRRLINAQTRRDVTASVPLIYPYVDMATQQRELGTVSIVRRDGQVLKRILRNKTAARQPIARQPVVSTRSAPVKATAPTQRAQPAAASAARYVQVGTFGQPSNAQATAQRMKALGLPVRIGSYTRGGKTYRLVLAGPFAGDASAALAKVRRAGFSDAFLRK